MRIIEPLEEGNTYHLFNRGINGENIFKEERNYNYFLQKYNEYCSPVLETYAYALLKNHFHLLVKVKENIVETRRDGKGEIKLNASRQLSHFFNSYAQAINKSFNRHGKLFEEPFNRILVNSENYFTSLIYYIHFNPQLHLFVKDFRDWNFTSYHSLLSNNSDNDFLEKAKVIEWFGNKSFFREAHIGNMPFSNISDLVIE